jgi:hypothetical protein
MSDSVVMMRERLETSCTFIYSYSNTKAIYRRKIRIKEGNAKFRHLKIIDLYSIRTSRQVIICLRSRTLSLPLLTVYVLVYSILIHTGKGGELNQREGE